MEEYLENISVGEKIDRFGTVNVTDRDIINRYGSYNCSELEMREIDERK